MLRLRMALADSRESGGVRKLAWLLLLILQPEASGKMQGFGMKFIIAVIKPFKLDEVREALGAIGVAGMTVSEVKGFGRQKGQTEVYRGAEYSTNMLPKVKLEIAASDDVAQQVVETIQQTANTEAIGDGKIFVLDLASATRIRTGETGETAL
jgi:nitrogen regulatory protein P-II 2